MHNFFQENIPEKINPLCPAMPEIKKDLNGVLKCLSNLKPDKDVGPDSIKPVVLLLLYAPSCFRKPYKLDNAPKLEKGTILSFIQKRSRTLTLYRLISLTCFYVKIASNISKHLNEHNVVYELKHCFCEYRSCETHLIQLVEDLGR